MQHRQSPWLPTSHRADFVRVHSCRCHLRVGSWYSRWLCYCHPVRPHTHMGKGLQHYGRCLFHGLELELLSSGIGSCMVDVEGLMLFHSSLAARHSLTTAARAWSVYPLIIKCVDTHSAALTIPGLTVHHLCLTYLFCCRLNLSGLQHHRLYLLFHLQLAVLLVQGRATRLHAPSQRQAQPGTPPDTPRHLLFNPAFRLGASVGCLLCHPRSCPDPGHSGPDCSLRARQPKGVAHVLGTPWKLLE